MKRKLFLGLSLTLSVLVMLASWLMNMGWVRFIGTFLLLPLYHGGIFIAANLVSNRHFEDNKYIPLLMFLSHITFLLSHILMMDTSDYGPSYFFFGLIHNDVAANIANHIAGFILVAVHIPTLVIQFILGCRPKR